MSTETTRLLIEFESAIHFFHAMDTPEEALKAKQLLKEARDNLIKRIESIEP